MWAAAPVVAFCLRCDVFGSLFRHTVSIADRSRFLLCNPASLLLILHDLYFKIILARPSKWELRRATVTESVILCVVEPPLAADTVTE